MGEYRGLSAAVFCVFLLASCKFDRPPRLVDAAGEIDAIAIDAVETACEPDSEVCANDHYVGCSAAGTVEVELDCVLGCDDVEPKCRDVDPSNDVAMYLDQARTDPAAPDLVLGEGSTIDTTTGMVFNAGSSVTVPNAAVGSNTVFVVKSLAVTGSVVVTGTAGLIIVSEGDVEVAALIDLSATLNSSTNRSIDGPGGGPGSCDGGTSATTTSAFSGGGGGGGNGESGAGGGVGEGVQAGGIGGTALADLALDPLRGGCPGGRATEGGSTCVSSRGGGGGALQIVSRTRISFTGSGAVDASGGGGLPARSGFDTCGSTNARGGGGGGSGGSVLLEAPQVVLDGAGVVLSTNGGGGSAAGVSTIALFGTDGGLQAAPAEGGINATTNANGGKGGTATVAPENGAAGGANEDGGGGGGAVGRVRFNTTSGTITPMGGASIRSKFSNGTLGTRLVPE